MAGAVAVGTAALAGLRSVGAVGDLDTARAIAFWTALGVVLSVWIYTAAQTRKRALATIQAAIERGHPLDAQTVRLLLGESSPADKRRDLRLHAFVWLALGAGFLILALVGFAHVHGVFAGVSAIFSCLGLGLFIASRHDSGSDADSDGSN